MKKAKKLALAGIFTAMSFIFMFIGSVFETLDLSASALASLVILASLIELGRSWAFGVYAASSVISLLLLPNKTAAIVFACFAGFYPILKTVLNKIRPKLLSYAARIALFNIILTVLILAAAKLLGTDLSYELPLWLLYILANVTFIAYDLALERVSVYYSLKLRKKFFGKR